MDMSFETENVLGSVLARGTQSVKSPPLSPISAAIHEDKFEASKELVVSIMKEVNASLGIDLGAIDLEDAVTLEDNVDSPPSTGTTTKRSRESGKSDCSHAHLVCEACGHIIVAVASAVIRTINESKQEGGFQDGKTLSPPKKKRGGILGFKELAAKAKLSPWHFHRVFRSVTDVTPKAYGEASWEHLMRRYGFDVESNGTGPTTQEFDSQPSDTTPVQLPPSPESRVSPSRARSHSPAGVSFVDGQYVSTPFVSPNDPTYAAKSQHQSAAGSARQSGPGRVQKQNRSSSRARSRSRNRPQTQQQVIDTLSNIQRSVQSDGLVPDSLNESVGIDGAIAVVSPMGPSLTHVSPPVNTAFAQTLPSQSLYSAPDDPVDSIYKDVSFGLHNDSSPFFGATDPTTTTAMPTMIPIKTEGMDPRYDSEISHPLVGSYDTALRRHSQGQGGPSAPFASGHQRTFSHSMMGAVNHGSSLFNPTQSPRVDMPDMNNLSLQRLPADAAGDWVSPQSRETLVNSSSALDGVVGQLDLEPMDALNNLPSTFYMTEEQKASFETDLMQEYGNTTSQASFPDYLNSPFGFGVGQDEEV